MAYNLEDAEDEKKKKLEITRQKKLKKWKELIGPDIPDFEESQSLTDIQSE